MHNREASHSRFLVQDSFVRRTNTDPVAVPPGACQSWRMRAPNFYAHPGFERAGLRRRESEWIRARVLDRESLFVPVWRSQNLVVEIEGGEPRAAVLGVEAIGSLLGALSHGDVDERLVRGEF